MAKTPEKDYQKLCRLAAQSGLINNADGKWISADSLAYGSVGQHSQAGYKYGKYDHQRKPKEKKTGCCRNWPPGTTFQDN